MKRLAAILLLVPLALLFLAPGPGEAGAAEEEVRIGLCLSMTGAAAAYGQMELDGVKMALKVRPEILGRPVKLIVVDTKSDKIEAANAINRLIKKEKVAAIIGPTISSNALAAAPLADQAQVPTVSPSATNPMVTQGRKYVFRVCFIDPFQGQVAAKFAYHDLKARRAAVLIDKAQDYSVALASFFTREFERLGGEIVARTFCQTGDQDFNAQLTVIIAAKPDVLYLPNYYTEDALVAHQARALGLEVPLLSGDGAQAPELVQIGKEAVEGFAFTAHFAEEGAATRRARAFIQLFTQERQEKVSGFHALGADAYLILAEAMDRAGTTDGPAVREALVTTRGFEGVTGIINLGEDGNAVKSAVILQVKEGKFTYLTTVNP